MNAIKNDADWLEFEKKIAELFKYKGYESIHDINFYGRQHDVFLKSREEHNNSLLIECKHFNKAKEKVNSIQVSEFAAKVISYRNSGDISGGYLITNTDFTAEAKGSLKGRPEEKFVILKTYDSFIRTLIDFNPYLRKLITAYNESTMQNQYEPLNAKGEGQRTSTSCDNVLSNFLEDKEHPIMILTGDYGAGKTTTCKHMCYELANLATSEGYIGRLPCYIPLKYFSYCGTAQSLISKFLIDDLGARNSSYDAFDVMNKAGLFILVLDGFDEMACRVTSSVRDETFRAIAELCKGNSKVIVTGRPGYFPDNESLKNALEILQGRTVFERLKKRTNKNKKDEAKHKYCIYQIDPLNQIQIRSFLEKKIASLSSPLKGEYLTKLLNKIETIYDLSELAKRPILLEMIFATMDSIGTSKIRNAADLYKLYTNIWLDIDTEKGDFRTLISKNDRILFSVILAWYFLNYRDSEGMHFLDLAERVRDHFNLNELDDIDHFSSDVRTATFLKRTDDGYYTFIHKSFGEYFCAYLLNLVIRRDNLADAIFRCIDIDETIKEIEETEPKIMYFLYHMIKVPLSPSFWDRIQSIITSEIEILELSEVEEETWNNIISTLADGEIKVNDLENILPETKSIYKKLRNIAKLKGKDNSLGMQQLFELLREYGYGT